MAAISDSAMTQDSSVYRIQAHDQLCATELHQNVVLFPCDQPPATGSEGLWKIASLDGGVNSVCNLGSNTCFTATGGSIILNPYEETDAQKWQRKDRGDDQLSWIAQDDGGSGAQLCISSAFFGNEEQLVTVACDSSDEFQKFKLETVTASA
ncbi:hypothetical protein THASP1DRAFT_29131 [Thamnocephalis sphaerospora]|uniref:Ricin B lectin domain-containing protein n=1 Tax=Thamnocephalis sphaerospora TaxID=78915 RepID=A0A4P9XSF7_9FUNG|nr:hypothetical protein THASP1DRAFT_29131 [Thamnocephalis sphaerospora]|eukprot:RKP09074.1 hypothetical protein THASP1DRAFT_29131 [Thamnocephalis sphaerospora]